MGYVKVKRRGDETVGSYFTQRFSVEVVEPSGEASVGRIVIAGKWSARPEDARRVLSAVARSWPKERRVRYVITCGGFLWFPWPKDLFIRTRDATPASMDLLTEAAERTCREVLTAPVRRRLLRCTRFLTLGVDSFLDGLPFPDQPHVELVALVDLRANTYHWTGKSYPTMGQERQLIRVEDFDSHFVSADGDRVLLLGCHDLNLFSPRVWALAKGWRGKTSKDFRAMAERKRPTVVLQHPHTTDTDRIWSVAWSGVATCLPSVRTYASAGKYYNRPGEPPRGRLEDVLRRTRKGDTVDAIVRPRRGLTRRT